MSPIHIISLNLFIFLGDSFGKFPLIICYVSFRIIPISPQPCDSILTQQSKWQMCSANSDGSIIYIYDIDILYKQTKSVMTVRLATECITIISVYCVS